MKNSKYIKVSVSERLPEKEGKYLIYHKGFRTTLQSHFDPDDQESIDYYNNNIEYWLQEVPDYEDEMKEMLEECVLQLEHLNSFKERGTTNSVLSRLETLLTKLKTES